MPVDVQRSELPADPGAGRGRQQHRPQDAAQLCGAPSSSALGIKIVPVSGVGDTACYTESTLDDVLNFQKGNAGFSASLVAMGTLTARFQTAQVEAVEKALALKALARI